ncbi:MAG: hypothetical protein IVW52_15425 [Acidimicrobiales bacterium]|nr:hypothetical protein [Acidimicrobiales bacterium]
MTGHDLGPSAGHDHKAAEGPGQMGHGQMGHSGHGGHHWMMIACCIPMIIIVVALVAAGTIGVGWVLFAVLCVGMMALMMRGMDHGDSHNGPDR